MGNCSSTVPAPDTDLDNINYQDEVRYFYIICPMFNPARSKSNIKNYFNFKKAIEKLGVKLITVECAYNDSPFTLTRQNYEPNNIQVSTHGAFFQKEKFINLAISKLPADAKYAMWCDCEVEFLSTNWINDLIKALHVFKIVQPFEDVVTIGANGEEIERTKAFSALLNEKIELDETSFKEITKISGYCWAFRVDALLQVGGLLDFSPLGNNEQIMAYCLANRINEYLPEGLHPNFVNNVKEWQKKALAGFSNGVGFIPGTIRIVWSGVRTEKKNEEKWEILIDNKFDPDEDLYRDNNGLFYLHPQKIQLREDLKNYFAFLNGEQIE